MKELEFSRKNLVCWQLQGSFVFDRYFSGRQIQMGSSGSQLCRKAILQMQVLFLHFQPRHRLYYPQTQSGRHHFPATKYNVQISKHHPTVSLLNCSVFCSIILLQGLSVEEDTREAPYRSWWKVSRAQQEIIRKNDISLFCYFISNLLFKYGFERDLHESLSRGKTFINQILCQWCTKL